TRLPRLRSALGRLRQCATLRSTVKQKPHGGRRRSLCLRQFLFPSPPRPLFTISRFVSVLGLKVLAATTIELEIETALSTAAPPSRRTPTLLPWFLKPAARLRLEGSSAESTPPSGACHRGKTA